MPTAPSGGGGGGGAGEGGGTGAGAGGAGAVELQQPQQPYYPVAPPERTVVVYPGGGYSDYQGRPVLPQPPAQTVIVREGAAPPPEVLADGGAGYYDDQDGGDDYYDDQDGGDYYDDQEQQVSSELQHVGADRERKLGRTYYSDGHGGWYEGPYPGALAGDEVFSESDLDSDSDYSDADSDYGTVWNMADEISRAYPHVDRARIERILGDVEASHMRGCTTTLAAELGEVLRHQRL